MIWILIVAVVALAAALAWWALSRGRSSASSASDQPRQPAPPTLPAAAAPSAASPAPAGRPTPSGAAPALPPMEAPAPLAAFRREPAAALQAAQRDALMQRLERLHRPAPALHALSSPAFLQKTTSSQLANVVLSEPAIAAKVLATVNSPLYGLRTPVVQIGQGITFLGLNTVRALCLQHLLSDAFPTPPDGLRPLFDRQWQATAAASELCARVGQKLGLAETGAAVTQVVLASLAPLAVLTLLPAEQTNAWAQGDGLARAQLEQEALGLSGAEIGRLLMQSWALPDALTDAVARLHGWLETPATAIHPEATAQALAYWCLRMGERLAARQIEDWQAFDWLADDAIDTVLARSYLAAALGSRLSAALQDPQVHQALRPWLPAAAAAPQDPATA